MLADEMDPITFEVEYELDEYLTIISEVYKERKQEDLRTLQRSNLGDIEFGWFDRMVLNKLMPLVFQYKVRKIGTCIFEIDEEGLQRKSNGSVAKWTWDEITSVQRLSTAYLIQVDKGSMPIPYRCLTKEQARELDKLIQRKSRFKSNSSNSPFDTDASRQST